MPYAVKCSSKYFQPDSKIERQGLVKHTLHSSLPLKGKMQHYFEVNYDLSWHAQYFKISEQLCSNDTTERKAYPNLHNLKYQE